MQDNTEEELLSNPERPQAENIPEIVIPKKETEITRPNQETENMEVHKHPHHITHKKKWGEYLLEFLQKEYNLE